jgi:hypothetical protein
VLGALTIGIAIWVKIGGNSAPDISAPAAQFRSSGAPGSGESEAGGAAEPGDDWSRFALGSFRLNLPDKPKPALVGPDATKVPEIVEAREFGLRSGECGIMISEVTYSPGVLGDQSLAGAAAAFKAQLQSGRDGETARSGAAQFDFRGRSAQRVWVRFSGKERFIDSYQIINDNHMISLMVTGPEEEVRKVSERAVKSLEFAEEYRPVSSQ